MDAPTDTRNDRTPRSNDLFKRTYTVEFFEHIGAHIGRLTSGDRVIFFALAALLMFASFSGVYALERSLLVEVPTYGGILYEGEVGSPQFMNPLLAISDADRDLSQLVYAGLMGLAGSGELVPVLAESYTVSPDGRVYRFTLRKNAVFTDGTPVTSNDVAFTVQTAQDAGLKSPKYADWAGVTVSAPDARTVVFTLAKAYPPFLELTTLGILPERRWRNVSNEEFPFSNLETNPVGAGPFKVSGVTRNSSGLISNVSLAYNSSYVLGRPYLDGIRFTFYGSTEDLSGALASGAVESAYDVGRRNGLTAPYARIFGVFFNANGKPAYARLEVRKALSLALDRQDIINSVLGGFATPIMGPVPPGENIDQVSVPTGPRIAEAAKVLTSAGWAYDGTARAWKNAAQKLTLDSITVRTSNVPELKNVASAVKAQWEKLGIPVTIELYEPGDLSQNVIRPRKYEALLYGMVIGRDQDLYAFWDSKERNDPGLNIALYANKNVDALLEDARSTPDAEKRHADLQKIEDQVAADYPAAFLYSPDFTYSVPSDLRGVSLPQIIVPSDRFSSVTDWYRMTDSVWPFFAK
ncbi:MAG TPA: peptide ABC transporter substrate-binding protein [Candidatus Paceibacterota bacterium]|nr:peptide ABC transporter substrate-binding protein [Candidatus Paceibacterota bacterium]